MTRQNLPPLEVGTIYRLQDFRGFEFSARALHQDVTGEDTAILRVHLANQTILEIPASEDDLHHLLRVLMEACPEAAQEHAKVRGWV
jgi:hypothetical protein